MPEFYQERISPMHRWLIDPDDSSILGVLNPHASGGDFLPLNERDVPRQFGRVFHVDFRTAANGGKGSNTNSGRRWATPYATMQKAFDSVAEGDTIQFIGTCQEEGLTVPAIKGVTVMGGFNPAYGAGSKWKANADSVILTVNQRGWRFMNFIVEPNAANDGFSLKGAAGGTLFENIEFNTGRTGILGNGTDSVQIVGCRFHDMGGYAIDANNQGDGWLIRWEIVGNRFINNLNHVRARLDDSWIYKNIFQAVGFSQTATAKLDLRNGRLGYNIVHENIVMGTFSEAGGYYANANDEWMNNFNNGGIRNGRPA